MFGHEETLFFASVWLEIRLKFANFDQYDSVFTNVNHPVKAITTED